MQLKPAILNILGRDDLKHIVVDLEIDGVDRRSVEGMRAALGRARRASAADLLWYMQKAQVKEVCELVGVSAKGKRDELVERLLNGHGDLTVASSIKKDRPKQRMANNHSDTERRLWDAARCPSFTAKTSAIGGILTTGGQ